MAQDLLTTTDKLAAGWRQLKSEMKRVRNTLYLLTQDALPPRGTPDSPNMDDATKLKLLKESLRLMDEAGWNC